MFLISGILCFIFLCSTILLLTMLTASLYQKNGPSAKKLRHSPEAFAYLFDVYQNRY
ncbi:hypothetical protein [Jeotgalibacillus sp. S-D1]|uniref:hypothetical protein n=1 Tax=Jeotgalibacillus sp. S-D1 TaxID=2552189 RepID=UPI001404698A|nr:hypothetical protein [Jeotgalibacillus sp. S-D1]